MRSERLAAAAGVLVATLSACGEIVGDDDEDETFHIRTLNLVQDSPSLLIDLDGTNIASLTYGSATAFSAAHPGRRDVTFEASLPADLDDDDDDDETSTAVGDAVSYTFLEDTPYTLIAYGQLADIRTFVVEGFEQRDGVDDERLVLQFTHASLDAPEVEVYITAAQAGTTTRQYVDTLSVTESSAPVELTLQRDEDDLDDDATLVADVVVELIVPGSGTSLYRSDSITFAEKGRVLLVIADNPGPGPAPVKLVLAGSGSGERLDREDGAALRFIHASHDTPALDVTIGSGLNEPLAQNVGFRQSTEYLSIRDGENGMIAVPAGASRPFVFFEEFTAGAGGYYSAYALGPAATVDAVVFSADGRSVPTQTTFRFLHGAGSLQEEDALDIYLRLPGATVDFDDDDTVADFSGVSFQATTGYRTLTAGSYDVYFAYTGTSSIVLGPTPFQVGNGDVTTLVLMDSESGTLELMPVSDTAGPLSNKARKSARQ